ENVGMQALREASNAVLGEPFSDERFQRFLGRSEASFFADMASVYGLEATTEIEARYHKAYLPLLTSLEPLPGVHQVVPRLAAIAPIMVVSGSTRAQIQGYLAAQGLTNWVHSILGCEDYQRGKPDPQPYLLAAALLGVSPSKSVAFEDSDVGVQSGRAAGMRTIALRCGNPAGRYHLRDADLVLESFIELEADHLQI
ncbi:MAG: HAD family phosphatase, partial [Planctomycetes bacterium]|nr:HAD family phosphatase [Planctomycetota bacterium]